MSKRGLTLIELLITVAMFAVLAAASAYVFRAVLISWSGQETRAGVNISMDWRIEEMVRELREATEIQSTAGYDEIRYTADGVNYYIYYLYNSDDSYGPPPSFTEDSYELRRAALTGGISGTFAYGDGTLMARDVSPPPDTGLSRSGNILTVDITMTRQNETVRSRTEVRPRNL